MNPRRLLTFGLALLAGLLLAPVPTATAEPEEDDISAKVRRPMERIIELMRENERALLAICAGGDGEPRPVDVEVPETPPAEGTEGESGSEGESPSAGAEAARTLDEMLRGQRGTSERIPGELEELVRMVPQ